MIYLNLLKDLINVIILIIGSGLLVFIMMINFNPLFPDIDYLCFAKIMFGICFYHQCFQGFLGSLWIGGLVRKLHFLERMLELVNLNCLMSFSVFHNHYYHFYLYLYLYFVGFYILIHYFIINLDFKIKFDWINSFVRSFITTDLSIN